VALGVGVGEGVAAVGVGEGVGVGFGINTPLFQTSFFPLLIHVYFFPLKIVVCPTLLHTTEGPLAPNAESVAEVMIKVMKAITPRREIRDMSEMLGQTYERKVKCRKV